MLVRRGFGSFRIDTWEEWWAEAWRAVAYAVYCAWHSGCRCDCTEPECLYCVGECFG